MTQADVLKAIATLWPGPFVNGTGWAFGFGQALHFMGLCLLFGVMLVVDLRLLGVFKRLPMKAVLGLLPLGTANDFARGLGIPDDLEAAATLLRSPA